jgi:hypothetical protein
MRGQMQRPQAALQLAGIVTLNNHSRKPLLAPVAGPAADQCNLTWHQRPKRDNAGRIFEAAHCLTAGRDADFPVNVPAADRNRCTGEPPGWRDCADAADQFTLMHRRLKRPPARGEDNPCPALKLCGSPGSAAY